MIRYEHFRGQKAHKCAFTVHVIHNIGLLLRAALAASRESVHWIARLHRRKWGTDPAKVVRSPLIHHWIKEGWSGRGHRPPATQPRRRRLFLFWLIRGLPQSHNAIVRILRKGKPNLGRG